jgi:hypothetical protein
VERELLQDSMILRYTAADGLEGQEHGFLICLFWYLRCLLRQRRLEEVENYLRWMPRISNHLGLLGEQYDPRFQQITGNIPQAYSHIGHVQTILEWIECRRSAPHPPRSTLLQGDSRRIAFWLNLFNTLVIHGVIAFGVRDSVKEVPFFFDRAQYRVGEFRYTLSDIEHGILRGNARPPWRLAPPFSAADPRLAHCVMNPEPRIHFALVCASRSCPPIGVYEESRLESQLATAARVFINATTSFDAEKQELTVSQVFDWYRPDFRRSRVELIRYIADHLYEDSIRERIRDRAERLQLAYRPYDWRLNR